MGLKEENTAARAALRQDSALKSLLERMPKEVQESFSEEQLANLKIALGARSWGEHKVDFRSTIKFFRYRYYYVFVAGRNRRELTREEKRMSLLIQSIVMSVFILMSTLFGIFVLYIIKSALGIDIFPNYSFGVWAWFKETFLN